MNAQRLGAFLRRHPRIGLDTSVFIYHVETNERYLPLTTRLFEWIAAERSIGVTSTLTMTELLVLPYKADRGDAAESVYSRAVQMPNLEWVSPTLGVASMAARARAHYRLRTLDAVQVATALETGATGLVTNDADFRRVTDLDILILDDLL